MVNHMLFEYWYQWYLVVASIYFIHEISHHIIFLNYSNLIYYYVCPYYSLECLQTGVLPTLICCPYHTTLPDLFLHHLQTLLIKDCMQKIRSVFCCITHSLFGNLQTFILILCYPHERHTFTAWWIPSV